MRRTERPTAGRPGAGSRWAAAARRRYGAGPCHLVLLLASFALAGYAGVRLLRDDWAAVPVWFVGAALLHDLALVPLYAAADRAVTAALGGRRRNLTAFVRVPAALSLLLLLVWFPLITRQVPRYERVTGLSADVFLARWLLVTAGLFAGSALWLALRAARRRRATKQRPSAVH
ncbi:hypothetical protein FHS40_001108 [Streptomyces spectabilis]|uniref:Uncharacterized protein n=1 Tax=Streptomyces spectabilis TaxID=68270 RepID=A0A7W8ESV0_STRST|nr:hypothetical protein [Streptomyces spectabilis]